MGSWGCSAFLFYMKLILEFRKSSLCKIFSYIWICLCLKIVYFKLTSYKWGKHCPVVSNFNPFLAIKICRKSVPGIKGWFLEKQFHTSKVFTKTYMPLFGIQSGDFLLMGINMVALLYCSLLWWEKLGVPAVGLFSEFCRQYFYVNIPCKVYKPSCQEINSEPINFPS